jgi:hypothetical protein
MKFVDRPFALAVAVFVIGAFAGAGSTALSSDLRELALELLQARMISPIQTVSHLGDIAVLLFIFLNNLAPVILSFLYPMVLLRISWTPPLTKERRLLFLGGYTFIVAFLVGFFSLGAPLGTGWALGGAKMLLSLTLGILVHGPLEFAFVLICVAEPLRITYAAREVATRRLVDDRILLPVSIIGLLLSAVIEVFFGI